MEICTLKDVSRKKLFKMVLLSLFIPATTSQLFGTTHTTKPITIAWQAAPRHYDPRYAVDANSQYLENLLHCSLIDFDKNGSMIGYLAKKWDWLNPTTLRVVIHNIGKFSNDTSVTAEDVKATYMYLFNNLVSYESNKFDILCFLKN